MTDWSKVNCKKCGQCNRKGRPSVMKGSATCEANRGTISDHQIMIWQHIREKLSFLKEIDIRRWSRT